MRTKLFGVLGWPILHSASPAMMKAAFKVLEVDAVYLPFAVRAEDFERALNGLAALGAVGVNVTIPHKQAAWKQMDEVSSEAKLARAVNTVAFSENGGLLGHNTDVSGWWKGIVPYIGLGDYRVVVLGNGGAARAVLAALSLYNPAVEVQILARDSKRGQELATEFADHLNVGVSMWEHREDACATAQLVVNTTPVGMWPDYRNSVIADAGCFSSGQVVQDVVYRPMQTRLLELAQSQGATTVGGLPMLVGQGAAALEYWLNREAPFATMLTAAEEFVRSQS